MFLSCALLLLVFTVPLLPVADAAYVQAIPARTYDARAVEAEPYWHLVKALHESDLSRRELFQNKTSFARSWQDVTLFRVRASAKGATRVKNRNMQVDADASVTIACKTCYVQGSANFALQYPSQSEVASFLNNTKAAIKNVTVEAADTATDQLWDYYKQVGKEFVTGQTQNATEDLLTIPPLNVSLRMNLTDVPRFGLNFSLDGLEVYMDLEASLKGEASYVINLVPPGVQPLGVTLGDSLSLGVTYSVDLIFEADAELDVRSGFHLKFKDGLGFNMALFDSKVNELIHNGGTYEMLPIHIEAGGLVLSATLRLGLHAGVTLKSKTRPSLTVGTHTVDLSYRAGIDSGVYVDLVKLSTNITKGQKEDNCDLKIIDKYQLAIGAGAGASISAMKHTWGPHVSKHIPVWTTTLKSRCALPKATDGVTSRIQIRGDLTTTRTQLTNSYSAVQCLSSISGNCPASLQYVLKTTEVVSVTTAVPYGASVSWPTSPGVADIVSRTIPFSKDAASITATSGPPVVYTAQPTDNSIIDDVKALAEEVGSNKKLTIGLSIGLGVPALIAIVAATCFCLRRRRRLRDQAVLMPLTLEPEVLSTQSQVIDEKTVMVGIDGKAQGSVVEVQELRH